MGGERTLESASSPTDIAPVVIDVYYPRFQGLALANGGFLPAPLPQQATPDNRRPQVAVGVDDDLVSPDSDEVSLD